VYRIHGHHCANVVTGPTEQAAAVLIRAGRVVHGIELARERRGPVADWALARGPGNLTKALGITLADLGTDLLAEGGVMLGPEVDDDRPIVSGPRVGIARAADHPWRFWIADDPTVSAYKRHPRAGQPSTD
jgi:DNA-3-methyladenine glycosylase